MIRLVLKFSAVGFALAACSGPINETTVKDMPTGYLCSVLDPNTWVTAGSERRAIFAELKRRNADCVLPSGAAKPAF